MSIFTTAEQNQLRSISELTYCNPFLPRRLQIEKELLGDSVRDHSSVWSFESTQSYNTLVFAKLADAAENLVKKFVAQVESNGKIALEDQVLYEDAVLYLLYELSRDDLFSLIDENGTGQRVACKSAYRKYRENFDRFVTHLPYPDQSDLLVDPDHLWACFFQIQRLFYYVFYWLVGSSLPAAKLRAEIWQSVLTHNLKRYVRSAYRCMGDISTLIVGPSGTGKELVARAISMSQYVPFDSSSGKFVVDYSQSMLAVHLAAMSPTLIESELFGHRKGAFTGATTDRKGLFESCHLHGTVFLDEIGELSPEIQVKLLRVLQVRSFQRLGDLATRKFTGKVIAATNRDFDNEMANGNFREDLYYRLCADYIETPSLALQLRDRPDDLRLLVKHMAFRLEPEMADSLADEVVEWIEQNLGLNYRWPGNVRELEQCIRNVMIRGTYRATGLGANEANSQGFLSQFQSGQLSADELLSYYCTLVYQKEGSYEKAARQLGLDRRTVKSKIDANLLARWNGGDP